MERQLKFQKIFKNNEFKGKESVSGPGSDLIQTKIIREEIIKLLEEYKIKTFIDVCGDAYWVKHVWPELEKKKIKYVGIDIVPEMIAMHVKNHTNGNLVTFYTKDIVKDPLPKGDLLLCRDVLVHLSFDSVCKFINNFIKSDIKYFLATTFIKSKRENFDYPDGEGWYPMSLCKSPFNFPAPLFLIGEGCTEREGAYNDKCLGLWKREDLINCGF